MTRRGSTPLRENSKSEVNTSGTLNGSVSFGTPLNTEVASLRRDVARLTDRTKELEQSKQVLERDHVLKLRVKDDLLRKLHEDLQRQDAAQPDTQLRASLAEADRRVGELMEVLAQKENDFQRLLAQNALHVTEMESRDAEHHSRTLHLANEVAALEQRLKTQAMEDKTQDLAVVLQALRAEMDRERNNFVQELRLRDVNIEELSAVELKHVREIGRLESAVAAANKALMEAEAQTQHYRKELHDVENTSRCITEMEARLTAKDFEHNDALLQLESLREESLQHASRASALGATLEQERLLRNDQASKGHTKVRDVSSVLTRVEAERDALEADLSVAKQSEAAEKDANADLQAQVALLTANLEKERAKASRSAEELSRASKDAHSKVETERETQRMQWDVERESLLAELEAERKRILSHEAAMQQQTERSEKLSQQRDADREKSRQAFLEKEAEYNERFQAVQTRVSEMESEVQQLRDKLVQAGNDFQQERNDFIRCSETERVRSEEQVRSLQERLAAADNSRDDVESQCASARGEASVLHLQLKEKEDEVVRLTKATERVKDLIAKERHTHQKEAQAAQQKLSNVNRELLESQSQV